MEENKDLMENEIVDNEPVEEVTPNEVVDNEVVPNEIVDNDVADTEAPLDRNVRLMSPTRMVVRRFFRSKLSIVGLIMVVGLFLFSFLGPVVYTAWGELDIDDSGKTEYAVSTTTYTVDGQEYTVQQVTEKTLKDDFLSGPSAEHQIGRAHV